MRAKKRLDRYIDGLAKVYKRKDSSKNIRSLDDLDYILDLYFEEKSCRQSDIDFAEQKGKQLTLKIATWEVEQIETDMNLWIDGVVYSIIHIDKDRQKRKMFFYLEEVRKLAG